MMYTCYNEKLLTNNKKKTQINRKIDIQKKRPSTNRKSKRQEHQPCATQRRNLGKRSYYDLTTGLVKTLGTSVSFKLLTDNRVI